MIITAASQVVITFPRHWSSALAQSVLFLIATVTLARACYAAGSDPFINLKTAFNFLESKRTCMRILQLDSKVRSCQHAVVAAFVCECKDSCLLVLIDVMRELTIWPAIKKEQRCKRIESSEDSAGWPLLGISIGLDGYKA